MTERPERTEMPQSCECCQFPLTTEERQKYRNRCRWCGAPEWHQESERTALAALEHADGSVPQYALAH